MRSDHAGAFEDLAERRRWQAKPHEVAQQVQHLYDDAPRGGYALLDAQSPFLPVNAADP